MATMRNTFKNSLCQGINLQAAVKLPKDQNKNEWIAMNTIELYNTLILIHDFVSDFCKHETCKEMNAGTSHVYLWSSSSKEKPKSVDAPTYINLLKNWINEQFDNHEIFPIEENAAYPKKFIPVCKKILSRIFRVYAHIYHNHYSKIQELQAEAHLYTTFKHYYFFVTEFEMVKESEMVPLKSLISKINQK